MALVLRCKDAGYDCNYEARAETEEELLQKAAQHGKEVHQLELTPEMAAQIRPMIRRE